ncbi:Monooxygenase FAD-binding protein [Macrophomina phaseolina MS6]|uniref:Monooxygenase FAD-binding protein n=1 Tax=Macrophomina phaseolina (strain MS6) TaxID=1126212 RepID=K2R5Z0_MACPH|nr:Monooxygenase FAD-binding protein [Macrophomina phaseolina MS6]
MAVQCHNSQLSTAASATPHVRLHLLVVGAGLAGLAAAISARLEGHEVTVLEKAAELTEVGAGLQVTPNATRLFKRWGIFEQLEACAAVPETLTVRRYDGTRVLAHEPHFQKLLLNRYGAPFWDLHRADLQAAMVARARALGVRICTGAEVVEIDVERAAATLRNGAVVNSDVILAADGLWSRSRSIFSQRAAGPQPTGDLAYRILLDVQDISDPELVEWIANPSVNFWVGPHSHVVAYSLRRGTLFNLVLLTPDDLPDNVARAPGNLEELKALFGRWDPM